MVDGGFSPALLLFPEFFLVLRFSLIFFSFLFSFSWGFFPRRFVNCFFGLGEEGSVSLPVQVDSINKSCHWLFAWDVSYLNLHP